MAPAGGSWGKPPGSPTPKLWTAPPAPQGWCSCRAFHSGAAEYLGVSLPQNSGPTIWVGERDREDRAVPNFRTLKSELCNYFTSHNVIFFGFFHHENLMTAGRLGTGPHCDLEPKQLSTRHLVHLTWLGWHTSPWSGWTSGPTSQPWPCPWPNKWWLDQQSLPAAAQRREGNRWVGEGPLRAESASVLSSPTGQFQVTPACQPLTFTAHAQAFWLLCTTVLGFACKVPPPSRGTGRKLQLRPPPTVCLQGSGGSPPPSAQASGCGCPDSTN